MKVFGRYLNYRLKQSLLRTIVFSVLSMMICISVVSDSTRVGMIVEYRQSGIYMLAAILGIMCTLIPILELSGFKNRRNLDTLYFFPIKRVKMALAHYLSGAIQVFTVYTISFLTVWIYLLVKTDYFALGWMPLYYLFSLILGFVMYSVFAFIFNEANTVADGVLFSGLWVFAIYVVFEVIKCYYFETQTIDHSRDYRELSALTEWGIVYAPINNLTVIFQELIEINQIDHIFFGEKTNAGIYMSQMYMFFAWLAVGIAAAVGYFVRFTRKGAEMAGEISESPFGFKLLIPLYGYTLLTLIGAETILTIIVFALMLIGYFIYRRSFRIKAKDIIFIACGIIPLILYEALL